MKDQFETKIKSLVEDFSYNYDPQAWKTLSKKLPKANGGASLLSKLAIAGILSLISVAIWYNYTPTNATSNAAPSLTKNNKQTATKSNKLDKSTTPALTLNNVRSIKNTIHSTNTATNTPTNFSTHTATNTSSDSPNATDIKLIFNGYTHDYPSELKQNAISAQTIAQPQITYQEIFESQMTPIAACKGPKITLDADAINYEDGTPRIRINAESTGSEITWSANGTLINKKNRSVDLLAFQGKTYSITAQAHLDGCTSTETIRIIANEDYNLLAVNAFNPQSRDPRNAKFMPYALTIREARFELIVIDPDNGAVVFKTSDALNAWDGTDQRSGQSVAAQKVYIWKVVLQDALPTEKTSYSGTIVRI